MRRAVSAEETTCPTFSAKRQTHGRLCSFYWATCSVTNAMALADVFASSACTTTALQLKRHQKPLRDYIRPHPHECFLLYHGLTPFKLNSFSHTSIKRKRQMKPWRTSANAIQQQKHMSKRGFFQRASAPGSKGPQASCHCGIFHLMCVCREM